MRLCLLLVAAACFGCAKEEPCAITSSRTGQALTVAEADEAVGDGGRIFAGSVECDIGWCVRDQSVPSAEPSSLAFGYCTRTCLLDGGGCTNGMHCETLITSPTETMQLCVR